MKHKYTDVIKEIIDSESVDFKLAKDTPREITYLLLISFENTVLSAKLRKPWRDILTYYLSLTTY